MSGEKPEIKYHHVQEGSGGTFTLERDSQSTFSHIGTHGLISCVGIYLPIREKVCFVAHINAFVKVSGPEGWVRSNLSDKEGQDLRNEVKRMLDDNANTNGWSAQEVMNSGKNIVLACPEMEAKCTGTYVVEGIRDFFGRANVPGLNQVDDRAQGFVVNHFDGTVYKIPITLNGYERNNGYFGLENRHVTFKKRDEVNDRIWELFGPNKFEDWKVSVRRDTGSYADRLIFGPRQEDKGVENSI